MKQNTLSWMSRAVAAAVFLLALTVVPNNVCAEDNTGAPVKEWTFLLFLNGHNNLDSYGAFNINQMEQVGSNDQINMVVQWASLKNKQTKSLFVTKDNDVKNVTSKAVETMAPVDMGDYRNLVEFVRWGVQNYPAKHYFIAVWNHGAGWHLENVRGLGDVQVQDISYDDNTGHHISTEELGLSMAQAAQIIGHKVDVYGSDACLMAMAEVAGEMKDSVSYFVGSEETEPGYGWPYNTFFTRFAANTAATPADVSIYLTEEYLKAYNGGIYGKQDVTFSAYDMSKFQAVMSSTKALSATLASLAPADISKAKTAANSTQSYAYDDYKDFHDFLDRAAVSSVALDAVVVETVKDSIRNLVISGGGTGSYKASHGISIWLPTQASDLSRYQARYSKLTFNQNTNWLSFLTILNK